MILKKIAALCKSSKEVLLLDQEDGTQWVGTGVALYALDEMPTLGERSICTVLDIPPEKAGEMNVQRKEFPETYSTEETEVGERALQFDMDNFITFEGRTMLPCFFGEEILFIQPKYLGPLEDSEMLALSVRRAANGERYIVAHDGLFLTAILMPIEPRKRALDWMERLYRLSTGKAEE